MTDSRTTVLEGLRKAMEAETFGRHFYLMAGRSTDDERGREVFAMLAEEEKRHGEFLAAQYASLRERGETDASASLGGGTSVGGPIFTEKLRARAGEAHFEMTALSVGMELELSSIQHYRTLSEAAGDPKVKAFFDELAAWEKGHYDALAAQYEDLKEDYWAANAFAPF